MSLIRSALTKGRSLLPSRNGLPHTARPYSGEKLQAPTHRVNNLEKKFLVWTGKYKTVEEVPDHVNQSVVERARNRMRIKIANWMMIFTAIGCVVMVVIGAFEADPLMQVELYTRGN